MNRVAENGSIAFDMGGDIYLMKPDGSKVRNLTRTDGISESDPAWSPDGEHLAFIACRECTTSDVHVMDAGGSNRTRVTNDSALDSGPAWSPDGRQIVYSSDATGEWSEDEGGWMSGNEQIWIVDIVSGEKRQLTDDSQAELRPSWSPDGSSILFVSLAQAMDSSISATTMDGAEVNRLTDASLWAASYAMSYDGSEIAFDVLDNRTRVPHLYFMNSDGTGLRKHSSEVNLWVRAWSPDGTKLVLGSNDSLHLFDVPSGEMTDLYESPGLQSEGIYIHDAAWQPVPVESGAAPSP